MSWEDLAPDICRQRMVIEGTLYNAFNPVDMGIYCHEISQVLNMTPVSKPKMDHAEDYGWCCFMHGKESGMHIYSWDHRSPKFFSIDIYTYGFYMFNTFLMSYTVKQRYNSNK